ncbi:MAG: hypothetical protein J5543_06590 [Bacteroidales bacterium]|nr:hypothetical protein [Bacteroidales bacterium]
MKFAGISGAKIEPLENICKKITEKMGNTMKKAYLCGELFDETKTKKSIKEVKMADNLGPMAWSFLPENEQVQYLQKIAAQKIHPATNTRCLLPFSQE